MGLQLFSPLKLHYIMRGAVVPLLHFLKELEVRRGGVAKRDCPGILVFAAGGRGLAGVRTRHGLRRIGFVAPLIKEDIHILGPLLLAFGLSFFLCGLGNRLLFLIFFLFCPPPLVGLAANVLAVRFPPFRVVKETLLTTTRAFVFRMELLIVIPQGAFTMKRLRFALGAPWEDTSIECL